MQLNLVQRRESPDAILKTEMPLGTRLDPALFPGSFDVVIKQKLYGKFCLTVSRILLTALGTA